MGVEDEVVRHAIVAPDKSRKEGIEEVPTTIPDPRQAGLKATPEVSKQRLM